MKIAIWITEHEIARTVGQAAYDGLKDQGHDVELCQTVPAEHLKAIGDINIGYGVLRNMDAVWRKSEHDGKPWLVLDRGYWKPDHYDGYYRVSLRGTQQTSGWPAPDYERWERLGLTIEEPVKRDGSVLICPPTDYVCERLNIKPNDWVQNVGNADFKAFEGDADDYHAFVRWKGNDEPVLWDYVRKVITFNSSVGWEALRRGIPCESDPQHSIVGAWAKTHDLMATRRELFATQAALQLTLDEIRSGALFPLMQKLLDASQRTA